LAALVEVRLPAAAAAGTGTASVVAVLSWWRRVSVSCSFSLRVFLRVFLGGRRIED